MLRGRARSDHGVSTFELALTIPVLMLVLAVTFPVLKAGWEYVSVARATSSGIRYATRADENARTTASGQLTRRPTAAEVEAFVRDAASPVPLAAVAVNPEPSRSVSGETVTLTVTYQMSFGPLAAAANGLKAAFFGGGTFLPATKEVSVSARGREE